MFICEKKPDFTQAQAWKTHSQYTEIGSKAQSFAFFIM